MSEYNTVKESSEQSSDRSLSSGRRSVLQSIGVLGLGGSSLGTALAKKDRDRDESADHEDENNGFNAVPTSIQTWTLRSLPDSVPDLIRRVDAVGYNGGPGYDGIGLTSLGDASQSELIEALEQTELEVSNAHVSLSELENDYEDTIQRYAELGTKDLVHSYIDPSNIETIKKIEEFASRLNTVADRLDDEGMRYGIHNHFQEFQELEDGRTSLEISMNT